MAKKTSKKTAKKPSKKTPGPAMAPAPTNGGEAPPASPDQDVSDLNDAQLGSKIRMSCAMGNTVTIYRKDGKLWLHEE
jgi:hypothetical protein